MTKTDPPAEAGKKPGLLKRLFGRTEPKPAPPVAEDATVEAKGLVPADTRLAKMPGAREVPPPAQAPPPSRVQPSTQEPPPAHVSPTSRVQPSTQELPPAQVSPPARVPPPAPTLPSGIPPAKGPSPVEVAPVIAQPPPQVVEESLSQPAAQASWWGRLKSGLSRSSSSIGQGIVDLFTKRKLDETTLDDLEDILIQADLGVATAGRITEAVAKGRHEKGIDADGVKAILAAEIEKVLQPVAKPFIPDPTTRPFVVLVVGVNGSGKTTTIGKLAAKLTSEGRSILLAAGDTFRAAAIEQLKIWGSRVGADVVARGQGADAAGLAFDALTVAREKNVDLVLMDTAGRLQNRAELMAELEKIVRVMRKVDASAPHAVLLVLDATVGQNALNQVEIFGKTVGVTGLVMTKLDGTARGGILVAIAEKFKLPVHFIGVGETQDDLEPFEARDFANAIAGLDS